MKLLGIIRNGVLYSVKDYNKIIGRKIRVNFIIELFKKYKPLKLISKRYKESTNPRWETHYKFLCVSFYKYELFGKRTFYRLFFPMNGSYIERIGLREITIGRNEFSKKYQSNKWLVPINRIVDLSKV